MPIKSSATVPRSLEGLLNKHPKELRDLFVRTLNFHAGHQIKPLEGKQLIAQVRKDIEQSLDTESR
jgi:flagellar basal body-associated protein FliL